MELPSRFLDLFTQGRNKHIDLTAMKFQTLSVLGSSIASVLAAKPPYFYQTGDSTVAVDGGWGDGFNSFLVDPAQGENHGKSGATTASFRASGLWDAVIEGVKSTAAEYEPIVTIQFGHNDQKETSGVSTTQYKANLEQFVAEVEAAGGTAVCFLFLPRIVIWARATLTFVT